MSRIAAFSAQVRASALPALFALSASAYVALAVLPQGGRVAEFCGNIRLSEIWRLAQAVPWLLSPSQLFIDWGLMVIAMMTPLIASPSAHVRRSVPPDRRTAAALVFLCAYWAIWCASFIILFPLAVALSTFAGDQANLPICLALALVFSASPLAQTARNACHKILRIAPFGTKTWIDSAAQGVISGTRCVAACWPWMLVPLAYQDGHTALMILVGIYLFAERIAPPSTAAWRIPPGFETLFGPFWSSMTGYPKRLPGNIRMDA